jgi:hypothetical protein
MQTRTKLSSIFAALLVVATMAACAHLGAKQKAVNGLRSTHLALSAAQDFERSAYNAKSIPGLTAQRHADISRAFSKAFANELVAGQALKAWRAGEPAPQSLVQLQKDVDDALVVAKAAVPSGGPLLDKVQAVFDEIARVAAALTGK